MIYTIYKRSRYPDHVVWNGKMPFYVAGVYLYRLNDIRQFMISHNQLEVKYTFNQVEYNELCANFVGVLDLDDVRTITDKIIKKVKDKELAKEIYSALKFRKHLEDNKKQW